MRLEYFQMLDRLLELDRERGVLKAIANVPMASPVFEGHFPGHPILPGVLMLETMAQASGYLLLATMNFSRMPFFASAKEANFRGFVPPGSELTVTAERQHVGSGYAVLKSKVELAGKKTADAELVFRTMPFANDRLVEHVRAEGARLGFLGEGQS